MMSFNLEYKERCYSSCPNDSYQYDNYTHGYYQFDDADENIELKDLLSKILILFGSNVE